MLHIHTYGIHICMESVACNVLAGSVPTRGYVLLLLICWSGMVLPVSASASVLVLESSTPLMLDPPSPCAVWTSEGPVFFNSPSLPNVPSIVAKLSMQLMSSLRKDQAGRCVTEGHNDTVHVIATCCSSSTSITDLELIVDLQLWPDHLDDFLKERSPATFST